MKAIRILGILGTTIVVALAICSIYVVDGIPWPDAKQMFDGNTSKIILYVTLGVACVTGLLGLINFLTSSKVLGVFNLLSNVALVVMTIYLGVIFIGWVNQKDSWEVGQWIYLYPNYVINAALSFAAAAVSVGVAVLTLVKVVKTSGKQARVKATKKGNASANATSQEQEADEYQPSPMDAMRGVQENPLPTISEKERILRLKEELNNGFSNLSSVDTTENEAEIDMVSANNEIADNTELSETIESTAELRAKISAEEDDLAQEIAHLQELKIREAQQHTVQSNTPQTPIAASGTPTDDTTTIDPYKKTILPRRSGLDRAKYTTPVGNTPERFQGVGFTPRQEARPKPEEYENKIFLGDSDRIWEVLKKQDRSILKKIIPAKENSNVVANSASQQAPTTQKPQDNLAKFDAADEKYNFLAPENSAKPTKTTKELDLSSEIPTIDWDD